MAASTSAEMSRDELKKHLGFVETMIERLADNVENQMKWRKLYLIITSDTPP